MIAALHSDQVVEQLCLEFEAHLPAAVVAEVVYRSDEELGSLPDPARSITLETLARNRLRFLDTPAAWTG